MKKPTGGLLLRLALLENRVKELEDRYNPAVYNVTWTSNASTTTEGQKKNKRVKK